VQHYKEVGASGVGCPQLSQAHTETRAAVPAKAKKAERREEARGEKRGIVIRTTFSCGSGGGGRGGREGGGVPSSMCSQRGTKPWRTHNAAYAGFRCGQCFREGRRCSQLGRGGSVSPRHPNVCNGGVCLLVPQAGGRCCHTCARSTGAVNLRF